MHALKCDWPTPKTHWKLINDKGVKEMFVTISKHKCVLISFNLALVNGE